MKRMSRLSLFAEPFIQMMRISLSTFKFLLGRLAEKAQCLSEILLYTMSICVHYAEVVLRLSSQSHNLELASMN